MKTLMTMAAMASLTAFAVRADYVTLEHNDLLYASDGSGKHSSLVPLINTGNWSNNQMINDQLDYYIGKNQSGENVYACTPNVANQTCTFGGKSLTLDGGAGNMVIKHLTHGNGAIATFDFGAAPVYLKSGVYAIDKDNSQNGACDIKMNGVVESPASAPFVFSQNTDLAATWTVNRNMTLNLTGEAGTAVRLTRPASATSTMQWIVASDSTAYQGALEVERLKLVARNSSQFKFGGCIRLLPEGVFRPLATFGGGSLGEIELAGGTLELDSGSVVPNRFTANGGTINFATFNCANPSDYYFMRVAENATFNKRTRIVLGTGKETFYFGDAWDAGEWKLIEFPVGTDVSAGDFELSLNVTVSGMTPDVIAPFWSLVVKNNPSGAPTLYAVREKIVKSQDPNYAEHAIDDATKWTSGAVPAPGAAYFAFGSSGKMYVPSDYTAFGGDHLYCYANQLRFLCPSFEAKRLTFLSGADNPYVIWCNPESLRIHGGIFECLKELGTEPVTFVRYSEGAKDLEVASDIVGPGTLSFNYRNSSTEQTLRTITLTGTNDNYTGTMWFNGDVTVNVANGTAFGGALDAVTYDAVRFTKCASGTNPYKLVPTAPVTFGETTRGWLIGGKVDFSPTAACPLTIMNPISICGGQQKSGDGVLALGGALKFGETFADEPGTTTDYYLAIRDGWIRPRSVDSFNGFRLYFDVNSKGIELDWNATGDIRTYGLRNVKPIKESTHFQFANAKTIQVRFDVGDLSEFSGPPTTYGLVTVPASEADAALARIKIVKPLRKAAVAVSKRDNGDGTTTLVAEIRRAGMFLVIK